MKAITTPTTHKTRVLQVIASSRGGGAEHVRCLVHSMDRQRYAFTVVMPEDGGHVTGADLIALDGTCFVALGLSAGFSPGVLLRMREVMRQGQYQIAHCHGMRAALYARLASLTLHPRPKLVFSIHGFAAPYYPPPKRQALLALERSLAWATDAWVCVSGAERDALLRSGVAPAARVYLIRNGIEWRRFASVQEQRASMRKALRMPADAFVATTVCRLYRPRDLSTLLRAFQQVRVALPQAHLLIVGDGPLRDKVEQEMAALSLTQVVHLLGMRRDVPQILGATDVFVLASRGWEGLPLTVLEAMAASMPVVASDVGGTREAVLEGDTGYLFQPGDAAALALRLRALANDPGLARQMGQRGQARVQELFTAERMARETAALYEQLLS